MVGKDLGCEYCGQTSDTMMGIPYFKVFCDECRVKAWDEHEEKIGKARDITWGWDKEMRMPEFELACLKLAILTLEVPECHEALKDLSPVLIGPFALSQQIKGVLVPQLSEYMSTWKDESADPVTDGAYRVFKPIPYEVFTKAAHKAGILSEGDDGSEDGLYEM
jgi:hypothetical protein